MWKRQDAGDVRVQFLQTDPVGYEDDLNLYAYVRNDPLMRADPTGTQTLQIGVELKRGVRSNVPGNPSPVARDAGGALEIGLAFGAESQGGYGVRGYSSETVGGIWGNSTDVQGTVCFTCKVDQLDGVDFGVANVDFPFLRGDIGGGVQLRLGEGGATDLEIQGSFGTGLAQEVMSVSRTTTYDIVTPIIDAAADAMATVGNALEAARRQLEDLSSGDR